MKIDTNNLEFRIDNIEEWDSFNGDGRWKAYNFEAYYEETYVGRISVERVINSNDEQLSQNSFFFDFDFKPPKPRPYLFHMRTEKDYRGNGIAGALVICANEFFKSRHKTPLHSGVLNNGHATRVWEKLVDQGKAIEYKYKEERRWRLK